VFVEELIQNLRSEHTAGNVDLAPGITAMELREHSQFVIA
jgi:hypothetical protein